MDNSIVLQSQLDRLNKIANGDIYSITITPHGHQVMCKQNVVCWGPTQKYKTLEEALIHIENKQQHYNELLARRKFLESELAKVNQEIKKGI